MERHHLADSSSGTADLEAALICGVPFSCCVTSTNDGTQQLNDDDDIITQKRYGSGRGQ